MVYYCIMYDFLEGPIEEISPTHVVVNCQGMGFFVNISLNTYEQIRGMKQARIKIHQVIKEDSHTLFGFAKDDERQTFRHLISITGVGATTARMILSSLTEKEVIQAILSGNVALLTSVKGIGPKAAQRIVLELKDKIGKGISGGNGSLLQGASGGAYQEALDALLALGFNRLQTEKTLLKVSQDLGADAVTETLIKNCLKLL